MNVKSKTALRRVPVGTVVRVTNRRFPDVSGLRRIAKVQTNAFAFELINPAPALLDRTMGRPIWSYFDKKGQRFAFDATGFSITDFGEDVPYVRYDWVEFPAKAV